ncbi:DUF4174 domain-containing protein [Mycolicibacterium sp. BiH015]|uniref:DUF4174 domain-containing protein n=1 Tax=Mycolicibacterium sp. BiH015 TaxID=3018808 RepID=UPI0022E81671|nr:DUF4174 domain-containing protein [Mycolicibacterium sp. BiH015]MDA2892151.1 DUF4174 domain-containing protein [Mycolicibacterium sp. BiH015]
MRTLVRSTFVLTALVAGSVLSSAPASAADLDDYLWQRRPLLVFAPTAGDPRLVETLNRIEATRCDFVEREMVAGVVIADGTGTFDGQPIEAGEPQRLADRYGVGSEVFTVVLIGKDGGEKFRVDDVPDLQTFYAVVDGMPMRSREAQSDSSRC